MPGLPSSLYKELKMAKPTPIRFITHLYRLEADPLGWLGRLHIPEDIRSQVPPREDGSVRVVASISPLEPWHAAFTSDGKGGLYIIMSKDRIKKMQKAGIDFERVEVELVPDTSRFGMACPEEFEALLEMDPELEHYFLQISPGKQRNILYYLSQIGNANTRLERSIRTGEYLKMVRGKLDFKQWGEAMKAD